MKELEYLAGGLVTGSSLREDLALHAQTIAGVFFAAHVDPAPIELAAETLARFAGLLKDGCRVNTADVESALAHLTLPPLVHTFLGAASARGLEIKELAALAVHLVDICEHLALLVYLPELPALSAKSDRTGDAARQVGIARHLRG